MGRLEKKFRNGNLNIRLNLEEGGFLEVSLLDQSGELVYNYSDFVNGGRISHYINGKLLKAGSYLLRIANNGNSTVSKLLV